MRKVKRTLNCIAYNTRSKRRKLCNSELPKRKQNLSMVSATHTKNYMVKDPLVDWLKIHSKHHTKTSFRHPITSETFSTYIMKQGIDFESKIIEYINTNKVSVVTVSSYITDSSVKKTISLMKKGTPVIHSAPLCCKEEGLDGIADLLIRTDYLRNIIEEVPPFEENELNNGNYYYVAIDIKYTTLPLRADGIHLLNSKDFPAYKAQLWIYNRLLGENSGVYS